MWGERGLRDSALDRKQPRPRTIYVENEEEQKRKGKKISEEEKTKESIIIKENIRKTTGKKGKETFLGRHALGRPLALVSPY